VARAPDEYTIEVQGEGGWRTISISRGSGINIATWFERADAWTWTGRRVERDKLRDEARRHAGGEEIQERVEEFLSRFEVGSPP
jgi:hypothetical protein